MEVRPLHSLYAQGMRIYHGSDIEAMGGSLLHMMRALCLDYLDEFVRLRGGAVAVSGGGILLPVVESGPPVPTLVASLVARGAAYLTDEAARIDPILRRVHPSPFPILLDPSDAARFPEVASSAGTTRGKRAPPGRYPVAPGRLGATDSDPVPVRWVVFPSFEPGRQTRLEPAGEAEAVFALSGACANLDVWEGRTLLLFRTMVEEAAVSRLVVGSPAAAADLILASAPSMFGAEGTRT
jgi:hypothetical protein